MWIGEWRWRWSAPPLFSSARTACCTSAAMSATDIPLLCPSTATSGDWEETCGALPLVAYRSRIDGAPTSWVGGTTWAGWGLYSSGAWGLIAIGATKEGLGGATASAITRLGTATGGFCKDLGAGTESFWFGRGGGFLLATAEVIFSYVFACARGGHTGDENFFPTSTTFESQRQTAHTTHHVCCNDSVHQHD